MSTIAKKNAQQEELKAEVSFTDAEAELLLQSKLARLATVSPNLQPHVVPITFEFDGKYLYFGGWNLKRSLKFRNLLQNNKVAVVVDDLVTIDPWAPRGVEIRGVAEVVEEGKNVYVKITPRHKVSWGLQRRKEKS